LDVRTRIPLSREQISLKEVLQVLWMRKWRAIGFTAGLVALVVALVSPKEYEASTLISAVTETPGESSMGRLGSALSGLGGLASLAGVSMGDNSRSAETIAVLQSRELTERFIDQNHLLPVLFAKSWDAGLGRWKPMAPAKIPNLWKADRYFKHEVRSVTQNPKTGLVTLTVTWTDPRLAAEWANGLVKLTNDYLRAQAIAMSDRNIAYLEDQAARTEQVGIRQSIYLVLQDEISKAMLARGTEQYALKILDPAAAPAEPSSPRPLMWCLLAFLMGLVLCVLAAFVSVAWQSA
jgi:uncharacterized protein involved in exopolysaccharide biosynthesis